MLRLFSDFDLVNDILDGVLIGEVELDFERRYLFLVCFIFVFGRD